MTLRSDLAATYLDEWSSCGSSGEISGGLRAVPKNFAQPAEARAHVAYLSCRRSEIRFVRVRSRFPPPGDVRRLRANARLTQEELAERSPLSQRYISGVERGLGNPTM
ncbi:MAG: helix-turn-helix domain-containing protein [Pseudomonadota bacterium]